MAQALQRDAVEYAFTLIVAVQPDPAAPFVPVADYNIIADPAEFAGALLEVLGSRGEAFHIARRDAEGAKAEQKWPNIAPFLCGLACGFQASVGLPAFLEV